MNRRGPLSKLIGGGVGFAREYQADRNARKEAGSASSQQDTTATSAPDQHLAPPQSTHDDDSHSSASDYDSDSSTDNEEWAQTLDEAQSSTLPAIDTPQSDTSIDNLLDDFMRRNPPPAYPSTQQSSGPLSMPVIIPQRRPMQRHRGFIRAYAPVLQDAQVPQPAFLEFLDGFEKSIKANPLFHVLNVAVWIAGKVRLAVEGISLIARLVTTAIHLAIETSRRGYMNHATNKYLDRMNHDYFQPRGLYCLLIKYKPSSSELAEDIDIATNITQQVEHRSTQKTWKGIVSSSAGKSGHDEELPEAAPLVFPMLDDMDDREKENAVKHFGRFTQEYFDRRARWEFASRNERSQLAGLQGEDKEWASRYSDPGSEASKGGLASLASGGKWNPKGVSGRVAERRRGLREGLTLGGRRREREPGLLGKAMGREKGETKGDDGEVLVGRERRKAKRSKRPMRRVLKQDTLYLMVVNMPSEEEMRVVREGLGRLEQGEDVS